MLEIIVLKRAILAKKNYTNLKLYSPYYHNIVVANAATLYYYLPLSFIKNQQTPILPKEI